MNKLVIASAFTLAAFSASAQLYGEIGVTSIKIEEATPGLNLESSPAAIRGVFGYEINPNLAVEGLVALGIGDDELRGNGQEIPGVKVETSSVFGIYAKPKVNFTPELEGFVRVGYARSKITTEAPAGSEASTSKSGFSYGLGVSYALSPQISLTVDYMSYLDQTDPDDAKLTGLAFGARYTF